MSWTRDRFAVECIGTMTGLRIVWVVVVITVLLPSMSVSATPAVKTVSIPEGFGAGAAGGRGGQVIAVTHLNDSGPSSLREALSARRPRIIRFAVEGTIELKSPLMVTEGRVTIDGETAPAI